MKNDALTVDALTIDTIKETLENEAIEVEEGDILNAIQEMINDCDSALINLIAEYIR